MAPRYLSGETKYLERDLQPSAVLLLKLFLVVRGLAHF